MNSDPNFLNRWLDRNPLSRLTRTRKFLTIPAFNIPVTWHGFSDIVGTYNFQAPNAFSFLDTRWVPQLTNYVMCVSFANSLNPNSANGVIGSIGVTRYRLSPLGQTGEAIFGYIPLYNGQVIKKNFRIEIWSTSQGNATEASDLTPLNSSVLGNVDYRYGSDTLLTTAQLINTVFATASAVIAPPTPDIWFDANSGLTFGVGSKVASWTDKQNHVTVAQADGTKQPTHSVVGYIQFLGTANLTAALQFGTADAVWFFTLLGGNVGGASNNNIFAQNGSLNSANLKMRAAGAAMTAALDANTLDLNFVGTTTVVEINTSTGAVWVHNGTTGASTFVGTIGGGGFIDVSQITFGDAGGTAAKGFDLFNMLAYPATLTAQQRTTVLQFMLGGIPLPFQFPANSVQPLNA